MILVNLRFPKLQAGRSSSLVLLPITIPAIVLVVGLAPIYQQIGRTLGTGTWTLAFAYGITVLPFAYRSIQASIDAVDVRTLSEAARSLGASWSTVVLRVLAPNLRPGLLAASLISVAVVLGEFTIASLLNRQVLQTAPRRRQQDRRLRGCDVHPDGARSSPSSCSSSSAASRAAPERPTHDHSPRSPRTSDNLLLADAGEGTRVRAAAAS